MSIEKKVMNAIKEASSNRVDVEKFKKSQQFLREKQLAGVIQKQEYSLPPIDTVGKRRYQMMAHRAEPTSKT